MKLFLTFAAAALGSALYAQSTTATEFECSMSPSRETPAVTASAAGTCRIGIVISRDASGAVTSAKVDFVVESWFGQAEKLTGLHIHRGGEGVAGPVVVNSGLRGPIDAAAGRGAVVYTADVDPTAANLTLLGAIQTTPEAYYVNIHTESNAGGIMRGQMRATAQGLSSSTWTLLNTVNTTLRRVAFRLGIDIQ